MRKADSLLDEVFKNIENRRPSLFSAWDDIVGERLKGNVKILEIDKGTLKLAVPHSGWKQYFIMEKNRIVKILKKDFADINIRRFQLITLPEQFSEEKRLKKVPLSVDIKSADKINDDKNWSLDEMKDKKFQDHLKNIRKRAAERDNELT